jgi:hypothetical protein
MAHEAPRANMNNATVTPSPPPVRQILSSLENGRIVRFVVLT